MLSQPISSLVSFARRLSSKFFSISKGSFLVLSSFSIVVIKGWLFCTYFSQIPSQPITMNWSCGFLANYLTSGLQITNCSSYLSSFFCLQLKSPKVLETLSPPSILPLTILPPAFLILLNSSWFQGLWSKDKAIAFPFRQRTLLESPALATYIFLGVIKTTLAVQPVAKDINSPMVLMFQFLFRIFLSYYQPAGLLITQSTILKVQLRA